MSTTPDTPPPDPPERLMSLDALRGFDMLWIIGGDAVLLRFCEWIDPVFHSLLKDQLEHVDWQGFRFYDLIFPLFLFLVGAVLPFSLPKYGTGAAAYRRIIRRTLLLVLLGIICNGLFQLRFVVTDGGVHIDLSQIRLAGVLQRIGICYGLAAVIVLNTRPRTQALITAVLLVGYWFILNPSIVPGLLPEYSGSECPSCFTKQYNVAGFIDRAYLPGRIMPEYYGYGDNEGLLSTLGALATTLLGALAGHWLRTPHTPGRKVAGLVIAGLACLLLGELWSLLVVNDIWTRYSGYGSLTWLTRYRVPVIKNIWTSSFVLVAGGWSLLLLALFYGVIDGLKWRRWAFPLVVIGTNAITIFVVPRFVSFPFARDFFFGGLVRLSGAGAPLVAAAAVLFLKWLFLYWLYRNRWFLRV